MRTRSPRSPSAARRPITVVYAVTAATVGRRLLARVDLVALLTAGMTAIAAGLLLMLLTGPSTSWTVLLPGLVLAGVGWGVANPAMLEGALAAISPVEAGMASGMLNFARQAGLAAGVAALGGAFHHAVAQRLAAGSATVDAVASGATAHLKAGLGPAGRGLASGRRTRRAGPRGRHRGARRRNDHRRRHRAVARARARR
jgi:hypothetical protein